MINAGRSLDFRHIIVDREGPENPHIKTVGDFDGDGLADIVVASSNGGPPRARGALMPSSPTWMATAIWTW